MQNIIAMAGLAEAGEFYGLVIFTGALLIAAALLTLACWRSWLIAAMIACAICICVGRFTQPWTQFAPVVTDDPDVTYWVFRWRVFGIFWFSLSAASIAVFCILLRRSWPLSAQSGLKS